VTIEPRIADESADPQRDSVYYAQACAEEVCDIEPAYLSPDDLERFARQALEAAGWGAVIPTFVLDVPDDAAWSGWHEADTRVIHLHPRLLSPWTVLHELAHWVDPRGGHSPRFCANHVELVRAGLGDDAADELLYAYADHGVEVDQTWLGSSSADSLRTGEAL
jgi:hypothetical protein